MYMSANGKGHSAQPSTAQQIEHALSDQERVAQYALAQAAINQDWAANPRWNGVERPYTPEDVLRLRGSIHIEHTLARMGAERLWDLLQTDPYINALGAMSGNQAVQQVQAGLKAIYVSGWQVAADANNAGTMYPDQSLYPSDSVPNQANLRARGSGTFAALAAGGRNAACRDGWNFSVIPPDGLAAGDLRPLTDDVAVSDPGRGS